MSFMFFSSASSSSFFYSHTTNGTFLWVCVWSSLIETTPIILFDGISQIQLFLRLKYRICRFYWLSYTHLNIFGLVRIGFKAHIYTLTHRLHVHVYIIELYSFLFTIPSSFSPTTEINRKKMRRRFYFEHKHGSITFVLPTKREKSEHFSLQLLEHTQFFFFAIPWKCKFCVVSTNDCELGAFFLSSFSVRFRCRCVLCRRKRSGYSRCVCERVCVSMGVLVRHSIEAASILHGVFSCGGACMCACECMLV